MSIEQYVNEVIKKIHCSGKRKKEIRRQLLSDIELRVSRGEKPEDILMQMGAPAELAEGFNEDIPSGEQKRYDGKKTAKTAAIIVAVIVVLLLAGIFLAYQRFPKAVDLQESGYFEAEQVEDAMKETIELLDSEDYDTLLEHAIPQMKEILTKETMQEIKKQISSDWGERGQFGAAYIAEIVQSGEHYAVGEMTVPYEKVSVTYRLTYDQDMRLAGLYIR